MAMLNHTPAGDMICVYRESDDSADGIRKFAGSRSDFDVWFKDECRNVIPREIDLNEPVPPLTTIFDSLQIEGVATTERSVAHPTR
jgi:hypothetical protein